MFRIATRIRAIRILIQTYNFPLFSLFLSKNMRYLILKEGLSYTLRVNKKFNSKHIILLMDAINS